jgi:hypothetical protein
MREAASRGSSPVRVFEADGMKMRALRRMKLAEPVDDERTKAQAPAPVVAPPAPVEAPAPVADEPRDTRVGAQAFEPAHTDASPKDTVVTPRSTSKSTRAPKA